MVKPIDTVSEYLIQIINKINIPNNIKLFIIRSQHFHTPFYILLIVCFIRVENTIYVIAPLIMSFILYMCLDGCFITKLEKSLITHEVENINIIDPYIHFMGYEVNSYHRKMVTMGTVIIYFIIICLIYLVRLCLL